MYIHSTLISDEFDEALDVKNGRRRVVPPVYNEARAKEKPMPLMVLVPEDELEDHDETGSPLPTDQVDANASLGTDFADDLSINNDDNLSHESEQSNGLNANNDQSNNVTENQSNIAIESTSNGFGQAVETNDVNAVEQSESEMIVHSSNATGEADQAVDSSEMAECEEFVMAVDSNETGGSEEFVQAVDSSGMFETKGLIQTDSASNTEPVPNVFLKAEPIFTPLNSEDAQAIDNILDVSFEKFNTDESDDELLIEKEAMIPRPQLPELPPNPYQIKSNDIISRNMIFATDVRF